MAQALSAKSPRELEQQGLQHAAIAAMAVEDHEIARRQRAHERAGKLAQKRDKAL